MADRTTLTIELESILKGLNKTLKGLGQIKKSLESVAAIKVSERSSRRATENAQRLAVQQQRLTAQTRELANRQERARQTTERLALSQRRLEQAQRRVATATTQTTRALGAQQDAHVKAFRAIERASQQFNRTLLAVGNSLRSVGQGLASLGATLTVSVTAPLVALGTSVVDAAVRLDSLKRGLTTIAGSSLEAGAQLERLTAIAKLPGIGFEEAIQGSVRLQAVGFSAEEAERALRQFSNAIALTGGGRENLENITVQLGQMAAQSKVLAQDLKPIISSAPAVAVALREAFGTVRSEELQELGISSKEFISILVSQLETLPRAAAGARNSFENFRDELFRAAATVGTTLLPALTRLVEVVGPIVTGLANAFTAIPAPLQIVVIGFTALLAAIGPIVFIVGQLTLGVGRLLVGFAELNAAGILPTIASLRALTAGTLGAAAAQRSLAATTALVTGGIGLLLTAITAVVAGVALYKAFQKDSITLSREQADALTDQIKGLKEQVRFISGLQSGVQRTADEQQRLLNIYSDLNQAAKVRVTGISDEEKRLAALREEIGKLIVLREQERLQAAASVAAELAASLVKIQANENERNSIAARIQANAALIEILQREQRISAESTRALAERGITASNVESAIGALKTESENLSRSQDALISASKELNDTAKDQVVIIRALEQQTGLSARELLVAAQSMGRFRGDVAAIIPILERYVTAADEAANATNRFNRALSREAQSLVAGGKAAEAAAKARQELIKLAAVASKEISVDLAGALRDMKRTFDAVPELRAAVIREAELQGKSVEEILTAAVENAFGGGKGERSETGLRNARLALADAIGQIALAEGERELEIFRDSNERQLQAQEVSQRLRLSSYREYLETRASLAEQLLHKEIEQQGNILNAARLAQQQLAQEALRGDIPEAERVRRQAQAAQAKEAIIQAETRLDVLRRQSEQIQVSLQQDLRLAQDAQIKDINQLEIQYAELQGRIEDALKAATVEEFREALESLGREQDFLNKQIEKAQKLRKTERVAELQSARTQNQRQIDAIQNTIRARDALAQLTAAEKLVENARARQQKLEQDLAFEVEFRGLTEEEAIKRRLAGEEKFRASLELARDVIRGVRQDLVNLGFTPPPELQEFIDNIKTLGLGELSLSEQFRLAQKEFDRLNDERIQRIEDVERAVRNRDIAEIEGMLLIRKINKEYVGDLEAQLVILKQIAEQSNDPNLRRQAVDAGEVVKDTKDKFASLSKQIESTAKDAFRSGFSDFFTDLADRSTSAKEDVLNFLDSIVQRINEVIAENLSERLFESLFGAGDQGGLLDQVLGFFGLGRKRTPTAPAGEAAAHVGAGVGEHAAATTAATALTTGATAAATALTTGGATAATTLVTGLTAAAASFSAAVVAAGAAFAAAIAASSAAQGISGGLGSALGAGAATGMFPAVPGGAIHIVEGGYPEAVLTTDPRHAVKQLGILREYLKQTRGLYGRIPSFAEGGMVNVPRETVEIDLLSSIQRAPSSLGRLPDEALAGSNGAAGFSTLRQIFVDDQRHVSNWVNSAQGDHTLVQWVVRNRSLLTNLVGGRR